MVLAGIQFSDSMFCFTLCYCTCMYLSSQINPAKLSLSFHFQLTNHQRKDQGVILLLLGRTDWSLVLNRPYETTGHVIIILSGRRQCFGGWTPLQTDLSVHCCQKTCDIKSCWFVTFICVLGWGSSHSWPWEWTAYQAQSRPNGKNTCRAIMWESETARKHSFWEG